MSIKSKLLAALAALIFALTATAAHAQSLTGSWRGVAMGVTFTMTVQPNGAFVQSQQKGTLMTQQTGVVRSAAAGMVSFVVENWQPRTQPIYHATGTVGGYYTQQATAKPPGGTWRLQFNGPNSVTMTDVNLGGSITFNRVG